MKKNILLALLFLPVFAAASHNNIYDIHTDTLTIQHAIVFQDGTVQVSSPPAQSPGAAIGASVSTTGVHVNISSATTGAMLTPTSSGLYLFDLYSTVTTTDGTAGNVTVTLYWTDDAGPQNMNIVTLTPSAPGFATGFLQIEAAANTPIAFNAVVSGAYNNSRYSLYASLVRIN